MSRQGWTRPIVFLSRQCGAALRGTKKAKCGGRGNSSRIIVTFSDTGGSSPWITGTGSEPVASTLRDDPLPEGTGTVHAPSMVGLVAASEGVRSCSDGAGLAAESAPKQSMRSPAAKSTQ